MYSNSHLETPAVQVSAKLSWAMPLLVTLYVLNFLDRQIINILVEPIKTDLRIRDWQIGILTGFSFALLYTIMGIPLARLVAKNNRPLLIGASVGVWSFFTGLSGIAQSFVQLVLARVGVGIGEAGMTPAAHSLIMDITPAPRRSSALATYGVGAPLGALLGMAFGGLVADSFGWRAAFLAIGLPGLLLGLLAWLALPEPRQSGSSPESALQDAGPGLVPTLASLARSKTFAWVGGAVFFNSIASSGCAPFTASFLLRNHAAGLESLSDWVALASGLRLGALGLLGVVLGGLFGICGICGMIFGGKITDRLARTKRHWQLTGPALATLASAMVWICAMQVPSFGWAVLLLGLHGVLTSFWYGPVYAGVYGEMPGPMRPMTSAIMLFIINISGLGIGPLAVGAVSDWFAAANGAGGGIRWSMTIFGGLGLIAAWLFWSGAKRLVDPVCRSDHA